MFQALMEIGGPDESQAQFYPHFVSLREFDSAAYDMTKAFHAHMNTSGGFKNALDAWNNGLDKDNKGKLFFKDFKASCKALAFEKPNKEMQSLFSNLITNTKRNPLYLTLADVDTRAVELLGAYPTMRFLQNGSANTTTKTGELTFNSGTAGDQASTTAGQPTASATESAEPANVEGVANAAAPGGDDEYDDDFE